MKSIKQIGGYGGYGSSSNYGVSHSYVHKTEYEVVVKIPASGSRPVRERGLTIGNYSIKAENCEDALAQFKRALPHGYTNPFDEYGPKLFAGPCQQVGKIIYITLETNQKAGRLGRKRTKRRGSSKSKSKSMKGGRTKR